MGYGRELMSPRSDGRVARGLETDSHHPAVCQTYIYPKTAVVILGNVCQSVTHMLPTAPTNQNRNHCIPFISPLCVWGLHLD